MADSSSDAISQRVSGVNWLVGLSGGAIGGALLKFDWLLKLPFAAKCSFLVAAFFFFASILCGVNYVFQLFAVRGCQEGLDTINLQWPSEEGQADKARKSVERAKKKAKRYQDLTILMFLLAAVPSLIGLGVALFSAPEKPAQNKYLITTSQVNHRGKATHNHTFLLNQETGEIWEMTCRKDGGIEFRRVRTTSYNGTAEEPPAH